MLSTMFATYKRLLAATDFSTHRFLYKTFDVSNRLTGIIGPRGTGKTTMLLQYIRNSMGDPDQCMYASLDNIYFAKNTLLDFVNELYDVYGLIVSGDIFRNTSVTVTIHSLMSR